MDIETKAKWLVRNAFKTELIASNIGEISGETLNLIAGLPADAEWHESNFD